MLDYKPFCEQRAVFSKTGAAVYFSHLDLSRAMSRAMRRAELDLWMSEGFSPRPHLVFTPPLPLGYSGSAEIMDFRLNLGSAADFGRLAAAMPPALELVALYTPNRKLKEIAYADYSLEFTSETDKADILALFSKPVMLVKKTKRTELMTDITKYISALDCTDKGGIINLTATLVCRDGESLSPSYLLSALDANGIKTANTRVTRTGFRDNTLKLFK